MKRFLLISLLAFSGYNAFSQLTSGNLAVLRYGTGSGTLTNATVPIFVDEYPIAGGARVQAIALPTTTIGANFRITGLPKSAAGATTYNTEGMSGLSQNGAFLAIFGYNQPVGSNTYGTGDKTIALVDALGAVNTATSVSYGAINTTARATVVNNAGTGFYHSGVGTGIQYSAANSVNTNVALNGTPANARSLTIFNNKLYCVVGTTQIYVYSPLPIGAATATLFNLPTGTAANQIALVDGDGNGEPDLIYVADDGSDGTLNSSLRKFALVSGAWADKGSVKIVGTTDGLKSLTIKVVGVGLKDVEIYASTLGNISTAVASQLLKFTDVNAATSTLSNANVPSVLATAAANTFFKSVTFTPGTAPSTTLPVKLTSFNAKKQNDGAALSWTTASENNNSHFDILRSSDAKNFVKIGSVLGKGNSTTTQNYSFLDASPLAGTNYYKLRQVDFDGQSEESNVVALKIELTNRQYRVWATQDGQLHLNLFAANTDQGTFKLTDLAGQTIFTKKLSLNQGYNQIDFPVNLKTGVYLSTVSLANESLTTKFIK